MPKVRFEPYDVNWCRAKRFPTANLVELLRRREMGQRPEGSNMVAGSREFYHSIRPERSEYSALGKQPFYLLRFTPDGSRLLALDAALKEVRIYAYRGVHQAAAKAKWGHSWELFENIFSKHIAVQFWDVRNPRCPERLQFGALSRDCAHVTPDSAFLVVSASLPLNESQALFSGICQNNKSLPPNSSLAHTTFYSIDLKKGQVVDKCRFEFDQIDALSGVYMMDWTLAILSIQHQTIHLLAVDRLSGQLIRLKQLGPSMLDDDPLWEPTPPPPGCCSNSGAGGGDQLFTAFRQAFLTFLYKDHAQQQRGKVQQFLAHFDFYKSLKMHSFQFLGPELLLIRMELMAANRANGSSALTSQQSHQSMFVLLEWRQGKIVGAFEPNSPSLFGALERHGESFKNGHLATNHFPTSMEHCGPARDWHQKLKESHLAVMSPEETRRRFLSLFPLPNTQHLMASPYLDPEMFHFDEHLAAHLERGKLREDQMPMKLFSRRTNTCHSRFEFRAGSVSKSGSMRVLFHPRDPLVISMNRDFQLDSLICFYMPKMAPADV